MHNKGVGVMTPGDVALRFRVELHALLEDVGQVDLIWYWGWKRQETPERTRARTEVELKQNLKEKPGLQEK